MNGIFGWMAHFIHLTSQPSPNSKDVPEISFSLSTKLYSILVLGAALLRLYRCSSNPQQKPFIPSDTSP